MKRVIIIPLVIAMFLAVSFMVPTQNEVSADINKVKAELNKLKQEKAAAERRLQEAENRVVQISREKQRTREQVEELIQEITELTADIAQKEADIEATEHELAQAEEELDEAIERVIARDELLKSRLKLMYMRGSVSYLDVLMQSTSFADFLNRYNAVKSLVDQDKDILEQNRRDQRMIEEKREEIEGMLTSLIGEYEQLEVMKSQLMTQKNEREVMIAQLEAEEREFEHVSEEQERLLISITMEEERKRKELERLELQYRGNGKLGYPLPRVYRVSSGYGTRVDPITGKKGAFHSGIDLAAPAGTNILAAEEGLVIQAGWYGGYGNTVIINHGTDDKGRELWTLYAHASKVVVNNGDRVSKGDKVAEVGTTGRSTGNHLHFGVYLNGQAVNPSDYVNF